MYYVWHYLRQGQIASSIDTALWNFRNHHFQNLPVINQDNEETSYMELSILHYHLLSEHDALLSMYATVQSSNQVTVYMYFLFYNSGMNCSCRSS